jgi:hypothetical protein
MLSCLRSSQKLLTRVDRHRARQGPITIDFRVFRLCRRTRAFITSLLDCLRPRTSLGTRWPISAAAHVPLPKITMSNSPSNRRFHATFQRNTTRATNAAQSGVGAGYRSGLPPSQTQKSRKKRFFSGRCGWAFRHVAAGPPMAVRTLYMGPAGNFNPVRLILPRKMAFCGAKSPFSVICRRPKAEKRRRTRGQAP